MLTRLFVLILCSLSFATQAASFNKMVVFGDSLSDNGNLYKASAHVVPKSPPYYQGHFTNGPVWAETLMSRFVGNSDSLEDYAVGGASAVFHVKNSKLPYSLTGEITLFDIENFFTDNSRTLFVIWAGGNDYLVDPSGKESHAHDVVNTIGEKIDHLIENDGARYFLIPNLPDLGITPEAKQGNTVGDLHQYTLLHNQYLAEKIQSLQAKYASKHIKIIPLDIYGMYQDIMASPEAYGLTDVVNPCYSGSIFDSPFGVTKGIQAKPRLLLASLPREKQDFIMNNPALRAAVNATADYQRQSAMNLLVGNSSCDGKLFWDDVHPTKRMHSLVADRAMLALSAAGLQFG